ncbi:MAG: NAD-dependent epimerase/dehydratase family protein [Synergistaceae bacterium]|nr:NAD-dependent epimerase/dehydratase family protein [Synergistaceae bacterium]
MKRILITGLTSYTGSVIKERLSGNYVVERLSLRGDSWRSESFSGFDSVIHTAGLSHDSTKSSDKESLYSINSQLAFDAAMKAKNDGARQFVFMSSSIVYGKSAPIGKLKIITKNTPVNPESYYGDSKIKAEEALKKLESDDFRMCILRCPMIYGKGCKGNYPLLSKVAQTSPVFPKIHNQRSMLYAKNFSQFVKFMIDDETHGIFWPQNGEYSDTSKIVRMIAESHGKKIMLLPLCEVPLEILSHLTGLVDKAFGSLAYDMSLSEYTNDYRLYSLRSSINETES